MFNSAMIGIFLTIFAGQAFAGMEMAKQCDGIDIKRTHDHIWNVTACQDSIGTSMADMSDQQFNCLFKCVIEKERLTDGEGKPSREGIDKLLEHAISETLNKELRIHWEKCFDNFGLQTNPKDETCETYGPLTSCVKQSFIEICKL